MDTPAAATRSRAPEFGIVVPTFNERDNLPILVERIKATLPGAHWEIIVVDDNSPDGTAAVARELGEDDPRIRCIRRVGRRGLAGACIEGMLASQARFVAVMDADLQHDETLLRPMLEKLRGGDTDLVVASRFCEGAEETVLSSRRSRASRLAISFARRFLKVDLTDPLSGFFAIRREIVEQVAPALSPHGFKILLDIVASADSRLRASELPLKFGGRVHGESKLDTQVALDFIQLIVAKLTRDTISFRFFLFCLIGLSGVGIHMSALVVLHSVFAVENFALAQAIATAGAIAWNFTLNNAITYRDQRLVGWRFIGGLIQFELICGIGAIANVGISSLIYGTRLDWWVAGLAGALMSAVWNYAVSAALVWRVR